MIFDEETADMLSRRLAEQLEKRQRRQQQKALIRESRKRAREYGKANHHSARLYVRKVDSDDE